MKKINIYLQIIVDAISQIEEYTKWYSYEDFKDESKTRDAVSMQMQHIWETTRKIVYNFWNINFIPTNKMIWFSDFVTKYHFSQDNQTLWKTVIQDLPDIESKIKEHLKTLK